MNQHYLFDFLFYHFIYLFVIKCPVHNLHVDLNGMHLLTNKCKKLLKHNCESTHIIATNNMDFKHVSSQPMNTVQTIFIQ